MIHSDNPDLVAWAVRRFMTDKSVWEGKAAGLLKELKAHVPRSTRKLKQWPKAPNSLTYRLRWAAAVLRNEGIEVILSAPGSWRRDITIRKIVEIDEGLESRTERQTAFNDPVDNPINGIASNADEQKWVECRWCAHCEIIGAIDRRSARCRQSGTINLTIAVPHCCENFVER